MQLVLLRINGGQHSTVHRVAAGQMKVMASIDLNTLNSRFSLVDSVGNQVSYQLLDEFEKFSSSNGGR